MDYEQLEARLWHALAFLKVETLGALGAIWRPLWWTCLGLTLVVTVFLAYPNWHHSTSVLDFGNDMIATVILGVYCGVIVGVPIAAANFL